MNTIFGLVYYFLNCNGQYRDDAVVKNKNIYPLLQKQLPSQLVQMLLTCQSPQIGIRSSFAKLEHKNGFHQRCNTSQKHCHNGNLFKKNSLQKMLEILLCTPYHRSHIQVLFLLGRPGPQKRRNRRKLLLPS